MARGRGRFAALMLGTVGLLVTSGAMVASGATASVTVKTSTMHIAAGGCPRGWECNDSGPLATQAACEAARAPSDPPDYYSFPCYYGYESYAPYDGGLGWYWTFELNPI